MTSIGIKSTIVFALLLCSCLFGEYATADGSEKVPLTLEHIEKYGFSKFNETDGKIPPNAFNATAYNGTMFSVSSPGHHIFEAIIKLDGEDRKAFCSAVTSSHRKQALPAGDSDKKESAMILGALDVVCSSAQATGVAIYGVLAFTGVIAMYVL